MAEHPVIQPEYDCQLAAFLAQHPGPIKVRGKEYRLENIRREGELGFFADAHSPRTKLIAMQKPGKVIGRPGAESWTIMRLTGKGAVVANFAVWSSSILDLA
ncbi:hypothetical protein CJU35_05580 [Pseudomonas aeruginosa]|nr:hypothetical protein [Pseudomonas aeruginosa]PBV09323.1 hypothetical protein CJU35_05580 [Pseudomonas aeruginosa]